MLCFVATVKANSKVPQGGEQPHPGKNRLFYCFDNFFGVQSWADFANG